MQERCLQKMYYYGQQFIHTGLVQDEKLILILN